MSDSSKPIQYYQFRGGQYEIIDSEVIVEKAVALTVNGDIWLEFMCTPTDLEAMALGFLYNEGIINSLDDVADYKVCKNDDNVDIWLNFNVEVPDIWRRTSGCTGGVTSVENSVESNAIIKPILHNGAGLSPKKIYSLIDQLFQSQNVYRKSGGVHTSALSDGKLLYVLAEDIGRHNTLDKIAGRCLLDGIKLNSRVLLTTGRVSSEMIQKSARIGASIVVSRTSPSSISVQLAKNWDITLIGYTRRNSFRVYTHPERILSSYIIDRRNLFSHKVNS